MEFDPFSDDYFQGAWTTYDWLRNEEPAYYNERQDFWALSRYDDVRNGLRDNTTFISSRGVLLAQLHDPNFNGAEVMPGFLILEDAPKHNRIRRLTSGSFTPRGVAQIEDVVRKSIIRYLDPLDGVSRFDFVEDFASIFPGQVIFDMFGVPEADHSQLREWVADSLFTGDVEDDTYRNDRQVTGLGNLFQYFSALATERRKNPRDDMMSRIVNESFVEDGVEQRLTDTEASWYALMVNSAGSGTTTRLVADAVVQFARHPDQWQKVLADRSKIGAAIEEVARFDNPVHYIGRKSTIDVELHGKSIPAGSNFLFLVACANRDERAFENASIFDIDRVSDNAPISFGAGPHVCIGIHLARLEARVVMQELADRWPDFSIDESGLERVQEVATTGYVKVPFMP